MINKNIVLKKIKSGYRKGEYVILYLNNYNPSAYFLCTSIYSKEVKRIYSWFKDGVYDIGTYNGFKVDGNKWSATYNQDKIFTV